MKTFCMVSLVLLLTGCHHDGGNLVSKRKYYNDHILIALRDIPVGTALNAPDFELDYGWTPYNEGACLSLPSRVLGHRTLRSFVKGETIRVIDIVGTEGWTVLLHIPNPCRENVSDGWSAWQHYRLANK